jgi:hypothetical protein
MKRLLSAVLVLLMLVSLCACAGGNSTQNTTENQETTAPICNHNYQNATCTTPKTCTLCGATEGTELGHNYEDKVCTVCGAADPNVPFTDNSWKASIIRPAEQRENNTGEILGVLILDATWKQGYYSKEYYANQNYSNESYGSVEYNGKTYYDFSFSGAMGGISFVDNGNEVTVTLMMYPDVQIVLNRTSETQFTVSSSTDLVLVPVGTVFTKN